MKRKQDILFFFSMFNLMNIVTSMRCFCEFFRWWLCCKDFSSLEQGEVWGEAIVVS